MWVLGQSAGITPTAIVALQYALTRKARMARQPQPDYERSGRINEARVDRFGEALGAVFPAALARSYVMIERAVPQRDFVRPAISDAGFVLRSTEKRAGQHLYRVEIALDETRRDAIARAEALAGRFGAVERTEKSFGGVWFESAAFEGLDGVREAAGDFCRDIMGLDERGHVTLGWHLAG
ncbi:hypothetical protein [Marimonas lutisalis]|uniref:hypothetical protein n=1 Tax=Marimonas lutisalis TaxID=2545756 RepID=UPI0010F67554|nr:hypothetical protein [Marimonas lutisalis]